MELFTKNIENYIKERILKSAIEQNYPAINEGIILAFKNLYNNIPDNKRISYGTTYIANILGNYLFNLFNEYNISPIKISDEILKIGDDLEIVGIAINLISLEGIGNIEIGLPYFEKFSASSNWIVREFSAYFFRKLIRIDPDAVKKFYLKLTTSNDPNVRRFVSESLRPVAENKWMLKSPDYSLSIIKHLFKEKSPYPRKSVGNCLSDYSKALPEMVYRIVEDLVASGDNNSCWIAYRACRNLVKKDPLRVMNLLKVDEYLYKGRNYKRNDY